MNGKLLSLGLSGERFVIWYRLTGDEETTLAKAEAICIEQTVEFPPDLLPPGDIADQIPGRIESFERQADEIYLAAVSYPVETSGFELTQLLNVMFGNSSIKPGIRVEKMALPESMLAHFSGPRFGRSGLRAHLRVHGRPLLCTAIKPMGLSPGALAEQVHAFALGGIDIIKDDHGLSNQPFCPFNERVARCAEAVARANAETGFNCVYMPNITGPADRIMDLAQEAKLMGAGALMLAPGLSGLAWLRCLADDDDLALPILSHPAFMGSFVTSADNGIAHDVLFGQLARLAGADVTVFPNFGGRFSFSVEECRAIAKATAAPMGELKPIFPAPGGGMTLEGIPKMDEVYGRDVIYLIGGDLHRHGANLAGTARKFRELVESLD